MNLNELAKIPSIVTQTLDIDKFENQNNNIYEAIIVMSKYSNNINSEIRKEFEERILDVISKVDNLEIIEENPEQIELSRKFEKLPKPTTIAMVDYLDDKIYYRYPTVENNIE